MPWLPMIGYHNTGSGEAQPLSLDTRGCRPPFIRNYIHHISRLAGKLTPAWNGAKTEPRRVARQVLEQPPQASHTPSHPHAPLPRLLASSCRSEAECINLLTWQRSWAQTGEWRSQSCRLFDRNCSVPPRLTVQPVCSICNILQTFCKTQLVINNKTSIYPLFLCFAAVCNPSVFNMGIEIRAFKSSWINDAIIIKHKKMLVSKTLRENNPCDYNIP